MSFLEPVKVKVMVETVLLVIWDIMVVVIVRDAVVFVKERL